MIKLGNMTRSFIKNSIGYYNGQGRMYNVDQNKYLIGYAEINQMATTSFSRIKVNKGWFFCAPDDVIAGDLVEDKADQLRYLVMSRKNQVLSGESVYLDATLYLCDATAVIERWVDGGRDAFGRPVAATPTIIASDVPIMTNPRNYDVLEQQDRMIAHNKISVYLQAKVGIQEADRIKASNGEVYKVLSVDRVSLQNIHLCYVDTDVR